MAIEKISNP